MPTPARRCQRRSLHLCVCFLRWVHVCTGAGGIRREAWCWSAGLLLAAHAVHVHMLCVCHLCSSKCCLASFSEATASNSGTAAYSRQSGWRGRLRVLGGHSRAATQCMRAHAHVGLVGLCGPQLAQCGKFLVSMSAIFLWTATCILLSVSLGTHTGEGAPYRRPTIALHGFPWSDRSPCWTSPSVCGPL